MFRADLLEAGGLQYVAQRPFCYFGLGVRNCYPTRLGWMFELVVTAFTATSNHPSASIKSMTSLLRIVPSLSSSWCVWHTLLNGCGNLLIHIIHTQPVMLQR